jgi:DNA-binding Lrp family transcriptional regulator
MNIRNIPINMKDRQIIRALQSDGRLSNAELAEKANLSPSACHRRVRQLEDRGLIAGYAMLLDPVACGLPGSAFVQITLHSQHQEALNAFEAAVMDVPEIQECHLIAGAGDYIVRVVFTDTPDFERIHTRTLTQLPGVQRVQTTFVMRTVKKTTALPI